MNYSKVLEGLQEDHFDVINPAGNFRDHRLNMMWYFIRQDRNGKHSSQAY